MSRTPRTTLDALQERARTLLGQESDHKLLDLCTLILAVPNRAPRKPRKASTAIDTSALSDRELYAYYKRTAPSADLAFWLAHATMSDALRAQFEALAADAPTQRAEFYRRLLVLQDRWREENNAAERQTTERDTEAAA